MIRKILLIAYMFLMLWIAAPVRAGDRFEDLTKAIRSGDPTLVEKLLDEDASLLNVREKGRSAVIVALFATKKGEGFKDPKANIVLQRILARRPKLDLHETAAVGTANDLGKMLRPELVRKPNDFGWSPLHMAAFAGNVETAKLLLDRGADLHARAATKFRNHPLQIALLTGQYEMAKLLLDRGADILSRQAEGFTPMHEAALLGRRDLAELLIDRGAEINSRSDDGRTPLSEAMRGGHQELAEWLRSKGGVAGVVGGDVDKSPDE